MTPEEMLENWGRWYRSLNAEDIGHIKNTLARFIPDSSFSKPEGVYGHILAHVERTEERFNEELAARADMIMARLKIAESRHYRAAYLYHCLLVDDIQIAESMRLKPEDVRVLRNSAADYLGSYMEQLKVA